MPADIKHQYPTAEATNPLSQTAKQGRLSPSSLHEYSTKTTLSAPSPERLTRTQRSSSNSAKLPRGNSSEQTNTDHGQQICPQARASSWEDEWLSKKPNNDERSRDGIHRVIQLSNLDTEPKKPRRLLDSLSG